MKRPPVHTILLSSTPSCLKGEQYREQYKAEIMKDMICIKTYQFRYEAEFAQKLLENVSIKAEIMADDFGGMQPGMLSYGTIRLLVRKEDAQRASESLKDLGRKSFGKAKSEGWTDPDSLERLKVDVKAKGATAHLTFGFIFVLIGVGLIFMFGRNGGWIGSLFVLIGIGGFYSYRESVRAREKLKGRK